MLPHDQLKISAFFPAFNESSNLDKMVQALSTVLSEVCNDYEIIIVNDGSKDGTGEKAEQIAKTHSKVRVIHHDVNRGYGAAVRSGINACQFPLCFFVDGDCQFDVSQIKKLIPHIHQHALVVGYRENRADPFVRWLNSKGWNVLIRLATGVKIKDLNCAFKLFQTKIVQAMNLHSQGAMINAEIFALAKRQGLTWYEVPVRHYPRLSGKPTGANLKVIIRAFKELLQFVMVR